MAANSSPNSTMRRKGWRERRSMSLKLLKRHVLTIRYAAATIKSNQVMAGQVAVTGEPEEKWTTAAITPAPAGIGMPTKYFLTGRPGLEGCGLEVMLKRGRRLAPAIRKRKLAMAPSCTRRPNISGGMAGDISRNPHINASMAGATPKVI